jgi:hypothetical protein
MFRTKVAQVAKFLYAARTRRGLHLWQEMRAFVHLGQLMADRSVMRSRVHRNGEPSCMPIHRKEYAIRGVRSVIGIETGRINVAT